MQATIDQNHRVVSVPHFAAARATFAALSAALLVMIGVIDH